MRTLTNPDPDPEMLETAKKAYAEGYWVEGATGAAPSGPMAAIVALRREHGLRLKDAKEFVETWVLR